jgi:hypothetical protein
MRPIYSAAMWLVLLACWRPEPWTPPPPPEEAVEAMREEAAPVEEIEPEEPDEPEEAPPAEEDRVLWIGKTVPERLTVVDDLGQPVGQLEAQVVSVEVLREETERVKIRCATCSPPITGWLQARAVTR